jgi:hypothetical protein
VSRTLLLFLVVLGGVTLSASEALARRGGLATGGCTGCHRGGTEPMVRITADPALIEPGGSTVLTIHISRTNGTTGGFYLTSNGKGVFADIAGQSTKRVADAEVVHSAPKTAVGDEVTFQVRWTAPATRGGVDFDVWGMSSNGDGSSRGDVEKHARLNFSFGCTGVNAYVDQDKDGFGALDELGPTRVCEIGPGYSAKTGDCNDGNKDVFPGAPELCNFSDDNCNGMVNEGLPQMKLYYDGDGDGFGVPPRSPTDTRDHCGPFMGYSARQDDCNDMDPAVSPGAMEICGDFKDNDCNGKTDENKPACGAGWCRRISPSCDVKACTPGMPRAETCNAFDDDCDGVIDNGNLCDGGKVCFSGLCLTRGEAADAALAMRPEPGPDGGPGREGDAAVSLEPRAPAFDAGAPGTATGEPGGGRTPEPSSGGCSHGAAAPPAGAARLGVAAALALVSRRRRR